MCNVTADEGHFLLAGTLKISGEFRLAGEMAPILLAEHPCADPLTVCRSAVRHDLRPSVAALTASTP